MTVLKTTQSGFEGFHRDQCAARAVLLGARGGGASRRPGRSPRSLARNGPKRRRRRARWTRVRSYTLLPDTQERCMATEMTAEWTYLPSSKAPLDYAQVRASVRAQLLKGVFGPSSGSAGGPNVSRSP